MGRWPATRRQTALAVAVLGGLAVLVGIGRLAFAAPSSTMSATTSAITSAIPGVSASSALAGSPTASATASKSASLSPHSSPPLASVAAASALGGWPTATGNQPVAATITVAATFDGRLKRFVAGSALGTGDQSENQLPLFNVADGGVVQNVIIGAPGVDGIHCLGSCTLKNVWWEDVGEDAATFKGTAASQTMTIDGGGAQKATDKVFQHNGPGTMIIKSFQVSDFGKLYRSCGNCKKQFARHVIVQNVTATAPGKVLVGINPNFGDTAKLSGITIVGDTRKKVIPCERFTGVTSGEPSAIGPGKDSAVCAFTDADVTYK